jgi:hypothetical protein
MANLGIGATPPTTPATTPNPIKRLDAMVPAERPSDPGWEGLDMSFAPTFSAGRLGGAQTALFGGRVEAGYRLTGGDKASLWAVGEAHAGIGNGLNTGIGAGLRGELGRRHLNVYGSVIPQLNAGISANGLTAGVAIRSAAGVQIGDFFGEVAKENGTNMNMTSVALGVRARF